jgi:single-stranded-DNA-specific exonuclease
VHLLKKIGVKQKEIVEDDVGFSIAPRINAASRMGVPMDAFSLLVAGDESEAERLAEHLDHINNERKGVVAGLVKDIKRKIKERYGNKVEMPSVLVLGSPNWKPSLLGLAANTCAEEFGRPVFLWGRDGDGLIKGSCRAGNGDSVHLVELMTAVPPLTFSQFGGHTGAGGFTVSKEAVYNLEEILNKAYEKIKNNPSSASPFGRATEGRQGNFVDGIIKVDDVTWDLYDEVNKFSPFGMGNPKPIFMIKDAVIAVVKHFGKEKNHLELLLGKEKGGAISAIAFFKKSEDFAIKLEIGTKATIIGTLEKSTFKWKPELRVRIVDVQ